MSENSKGFVQWFVLILASSVIVFVTSVLLKNSQVAHQPPITQPSLTPLPTLRHFDTTGWKTYKSRLGVTLKYDPFYNPIQKFELPNVGEPTFIVSSNFNFIKENIPPCKTYKEKLCLIPGKNWQQQNDLQEIVLDGKPAYSFFIQSATTREGGSTVLHVIQTKDTPKIEIALSVDGMGGEETFQQILSTFKFLE